MEPNCKEQQIQASSFAKYTKISQKNPIDKAFRFDKQVFFQQRYSTSYNLTSHIFIMSTTLATESFLEPHRISLSSCSGKRKISDI